MCFGGESKYQRAAAEAQTRALEQMAAAQKASTTQIVSKTAKTVKTNTDAQKRDMYSLRIPLSRGQAVTGGGSSSSYGLNIPL